MVTQFTGFEYLCIDACNQFGGDKWLFEDRVKWVWDHMSELEDLTKDAENKPLYRKAVKAIRKAQAREPMGHVVALDACCSGIQVMSALTGCEAGAANTGLINTGRREDAYATLTDVMNEFVEGDVEVPRKKAKMALMTSFYGSKAEPQKIFGEDTPELEAFYRAAAMIAPGAWELLQTLLMSWRPFALVHEWQLPDGFNARVKVMDDRESRIEVDELDHATFTYAYKVNEGTEKGLSNIANVVHSVDAYVLRNMVRRCNYDETMVGEVAVWVGSELHNRAFGSRDQQPLEAGTKLAYYVGLYDRTGMADPVILPHIHEGNVGQLSTLHLERLARIIDSMNHKPFPLLTIHDSYGAHPNNCNWVRQHYIDIFAELAESKVLESILNQLYQQEGSYTKLSNDLGEKIRQSEYALS